jgi:hypothetical protein
MNDISFRAFVEDGINPDSELYSVHANPKLSDKEKSAMIEYFKEMKRNLHDKEYMRIILKTKVLNDDFITANGLNKDTAEKLIDKIIDDY